MKFRAALANNDWMVDYADVIIMSEETGAASMAFRSMVSMVGDKQKQKSVVCVCHVCVCVTDPRLVLIGMW